MINQLIKEINVCLENDCYISALTVALTLPDICGKAKYPNLKTRERYIKWFDEYIEKYVNQKQGFNQPFINGELIYSLRCSMLHQGTPSIDKEKLDLSYFELLWTGDKNYTASMSEAQIVNIDGQEKVVNKKYSVNIRDLCNKLCWLAKYYYSKYPDKFDFIDYHIENIDFHTKQIFFNNNFNNERR